MVLFLITLFKPSPQGHCLVLEGEDLLPLLEDHCLKFANSQLEVVVFELLWFCASLFALTRLEFHVVLHERKLIKKLLLSVLEFLDLASHGHLRATKSGDASVRQGDLIFRYYRRSVAMVIYEDLLSRCNSATSSTLLVGDA